ncbi:MAG: hypothetical protein ACRERD_19715, partial [Candidatus Binatia bacterium]
MGDTGLVLPHDYLPLSTRGVGPPAVKPSSLRVGAARGVLKWAACVAAAGVARWGAVGTRSAALVTGWADFTRVLTGADRLARAVDADLFLVTGCFVAAAAMVGVAARVRAAEQTAFFAVRAAGIGRHVGVVRVFDDEDAELVWRPASLAIALAVLLLPRIVEKGIAVVHVRIGRPQVIRSFGLLAFPALLLAILS